MESGPTRGVLCGQFDILDGHLGSEGAAFTGQSPYARL